MRLARITYEGAIHHAMNRGHSGLSIFKSDPDKEKLLELFKLNGIKCKVAILAYSIMDNHYHLIIQNSSGRMSQFFQKVNSEYAYESWTTQDQPLCFRQQRTFVRST